MLVLAFLYINIVFLKIVTVLCKKGTLNKLG